MMNKEQLRNRINDFFGNRKVIALIGKSNGYKLFKDFQYIVNWEFDQIVADMEKEQKEEKTDLFISIKSDELSKINLEETDTVFVLFGISKTEAYGLLQGKVVGIEENCFILLDEIVDLFDVDLNKNAEGKTIAIWGAGSLSQYIHIKKKLLEQGLNPAFYFDSDCAKHGTMHDGLEVLNYESLSEDERKKFFIVICSAYFAEIADKLSRNGLIEGKDFVTYLAVTTNAAKMMKKTMYAPIVDGPVCSLPFEMANIHREGIYVCPPDWINQLSIGVSTEDLNNAWNSLAAEVFRLSIANGTFCFCNLELCGLMNEKAIEANKQNNSYDKYSKSETPSMLVLSHDHTCNLWCESCRKCLSVAQGEELEYAKNISQELEKSDWLDKAEKLLIAGDGEVFSSRVYRDILYSDSRTRESICILTNGNLLNEKVFEKLSSKYKKIDIEVSIDAACKATYERLRRGGNWEQLYANLKMLGRYRSEGKIRYLCIRMVVQSTNIAEMPQFVKLGKEIGADLVRFARIRNFGSYSEEEFKNITIMTADNSEGEIKPQFKDILSDPILRDPIVGLYDMEKLVDSDNMITMSEMSENFDNFIYL